MNNYVRYASTLRHIFRHLKVPNVEPKWVDAKRKVTEPEGLLGAYELTDRVYWVFHCPHYKHLSITQKVA